MELAAALRGGSLVVLGAKITIGDRLPNAGFYEVRHNFRNAGSMCGAPRQTFETPDCKDRERAGFSFGLGLKFRLVRHEADNIGRED